MTHRPPKEWTPIMKAKGILSRRYQIAKTAEWGHCKFEDTNLEDMMWESGMLEGIIDDISTGQNQDEVAITETQNKEISAWVIHTANEWLLDKAKEAGVEMHMCIGGCGQVTCADKDGKFLCVCRWKGHGD